MRWLWVWSVGCAGRIPGMELGGSEPPLADRHLRSCTATMEVTEDGGPIQVQRWTWDDQGRRTSAERDELADGSVDLALTTTFDDDDRPVATEGASEVPSNVWSEAWSYDEDGYLDRYTLEATVVESGLFTTQVVDTQYVWVDDRIDRSVDLDSTLPTSWSWSEDGLEATLVSDVSTTVTTWNEDGTLARRVESIALATNGIETVWSYDEEGRMTGATLDWTSDGNVDIATSWTWSCGAGAGR